MFASFAEFERELIRDRKLAGLQRARENGRIGGRKKGLTEEAKNKALAALQLTQKNNIIPADERKSIESICKVF